MSTASLWPRHVKGSETEMRGPNHVTSHNAHTESTWGLQPIFHSFSVATCKASWRWALWCWEFLHRHWCVLLMPSALFLPLQVQELGPASHRSQAFPLDFSVKHSWTPAGDLQWPIRSHTVATDWFSGDLLYIQVRATLHHAAVTVAGNNQYIPSTQGLSIVVYKYNLKT